MAVDLNRLLTVTGTAYKGPEQFEVSWVMSDPDDFIEGNPDLPSKDTDLETAQIPGAEPGKKYWEQASRLVYRAVPLTA